MSNFLVGAIAGIILGALAIGAVADARPALRERDEGHTTMQAMAAKAPVVNRPGTPTGDGAAFAPRSLHVSRSLSAQPRPDPAPRAVRRCGGNAHCWSTGYWFQKRRADRLAAIHQDRFYPSVVHAMRLASALYDVPVSEQKAVAYCESKFWPYARNGQYLGLFQLGGSFHRRGVLKGPFRGFSVFDIYANVFTAAYTVRANGSWRQWSCRP